MAFNMTIAVLRDTTLDQIGVVAAEPLGFDAVTSAMEARMTGSQVGHDVVVVDPMAGLQAVEVAQRLGCQAYVVALSGVSDTYVIQATGPVERLLVHQDGQVVQDEGPALPGESALAGERYLEDGHLAVLAALGAPISTLWDAPFVALSTG